ncbi:Protein phosphatase 1 regulatory subunit sds22 [Venturia effusa]|uniref:Protein phosphatase 1 regulatory subunit sds22 n=1 Tax=Venturia effusa TaxID=50376 RepID=A0A517LGW0_9PEZI|nr:Protein phosphatase 1 regulatory subunit sds22 [Venturia effusa]
MSTEKSEENTKAPAEVTPADILTETEPHAHIVEPPAEQGHKHSTSGSSLHNAKGWDGKLRVEKKAVLVNPEVLDSTYQSDAEDSDDDAVPVDQIEADEDLTADMEDDIDEIDLVHCRISSMSSLKLDRFTNLHRLCLRQNAISEIEVPESLGPKLTELDVYDNMISHIKGLDALTALTVLDLSFNKIKHIKRLQHLIHLTDLYFVQNKISTIENLEGLSKLRNLELGGNRIREIQNLETLTALEELWLGKNKLTEIKGLDTLTNLKILSIQSNRLRSITGLESLTSLEELHISHNAITSLAGLSQTNSLRVIDISNNPITKLEGLETLANLEEFWASYCKFDSFQDVEKQLADKKNLETVYFEGNMLQLRNPALYRNKVRLALPQVKQIDATFVKVS